MTADRRLERALLANFAIHGLALVGMVTLLVAALPGGSDRSDLERVAVIAAHPWRFRIGWMPWQLCAVADLWLAIALVRTAWIPRVPAIATLVLTLAAVIPDQYAQAVWVTRGVALATGGTPDAYLALERAIFPLTAGWGALGYTLAALGWTACFAGARTWSRALTILSVTTWTTMGVAVAGPLVGAPAKVVSIANAIGFVQLQLWLALVAEQVLRRARPDGAHGRLARWRHPRLRPLDAVANSRLVHAFTEPLPELAMASDITDVVYVNYLVDADRLAPLVPPGLRLQRLGPRGDRALFTFLTYRHGHFGPRALGPLRRAFPSPLQSNWRIHVEDAGSGRRGIYFVTTAIGSTPLALAARLLAEGMPMHVLAASSSLVRTGDRLTLALEPGRGSAPDARVDVAPAAPELPASWTETFADYRAFLAYCVPQDRAMSTIPAKARLARHEIDLGIPLDACVPLAGTVESAAARALVGDTAPVCFLVPAVRFRFAGEHHDPLTA